MGVGLSGSSGFSKMSRMSGLSGLVRIVKIVWVNVQIANCFWIIWEIDGEIVQGIVLVVVRIVTGCPD